MKTPLHLGKAPIMAAATAVAAVWLWVVGLAAAPFSPSQGPAPQVARSTPTPTRVPGAALTIQGGMERQLVSDANNNGVLDPGDTVRYSITYSNSGTIALSNVEIVDDYDQTAVAAVAKISADGIDDRNTIRWKIGSLAVGAGGTLVYDATLISAFPPDGPRRVKNQLGITSDETGVTGAGFEVDVQVPNLKISKSRELIGDVNGDGRPDAGDTISYTITVKNVGEVDAVDLLVRDDYDQKLLDSPVTITNGGINDGDTIMWEFDRVNAGHEQSVTYDARIISAFPVGRSTVKNTVSVSSQGTLPITEENTMEIEVVPTPTPTAAVEPTAAAGPPSQSAGPTGQVITAAAQAWLAGGFLLFALGGLLGMGYLTRRGIAIPDALRVAFILALLMGAVIILGLAGSVERSAIAGLIGTVAGYVLRGAVEAGTASKESKAPGKPQR